MSSIEDDLGQPGDQYVFVAIDQDTKLIPTFLIGKRNGPNAERFGPCSTLPIGSGHRNRVRQGSNFGLFLGWVRSLSGAVDLAFANTVHYGVIVKTFREGMEQPGRDGPPEITATVRNIMVGSVEPETISTSYAERNNLTIRTFIRRFTRLSLGFSKKLENLVAAVCLHMAHYNFCRRHGTLRDDSRDGRERDR